MMHHTYSSCSSIISFRTSFWYSDCIYTNYYQNERCPPRFCCVCGSFNVNSSRLMLPMNLNPSILYGLRQSSLIQLPHSRRFVVGSNDRNCYWVSNFDVGRCCSGECCCVKEERVVGSREEKCCVEKKRPSVGVDRVLGRNFKESSSGGGGEIRSRLSRRERDFRLVDAEAMLSLLSEESIGECVLGTERRKGLSKEARIVRGQNVVIVKSGDGNDNDALGYPETNPKKQEERCNRKQERDGLSGDEDQRLRRRESTSSYYSVSDEFESETEVDINEEVYVGQSLTSQKNDSRKDGGVVISEVNKEDTKRHRNQKDQQILSSSHDGVRVGSSAEWDCRKKSEKKLTEESIEGSNRKESVLHKSNVSQANESSSVVASSPKSQFKHQGEESTSDLSSHGQFRRSIIKDDHSEYSKFNGRKDHLTSGASSHVHSRSDTTLGYQASDCMVSGRRQEQSVLDSSFRWQPVSQINATDQASEYSISGQQHEQATQVDRRYVEATTAARMQGEGTMYVGLPVQGTECEHCRTCGRSLQENKNETDIQRRVEFSDIHSDARWSTNVQTQSGSRLREQEFDASTQQGSVEEESKLRNQLFSTTQSGARVSAGKYSQTAVTENTLRSQQLSEARMKIMEASSSLYSSAHYGEKLLEESASKVIEEPSQVLQTSASASQVPTSCEVINHNSVADKRLYHKQSYSSSKVKSVNELVAKRKLIDETIVLTKHRTEVQAVQAPLLQASTTGNFSGQGNLPQPIAPLISEPGDEHFNEVKDNYQLQLPMMSSSYQLVESKCSDGKLSSNFEIKDSGRITEAGSDTTHVEPLARRPSSTTDVDDSGIRSPADALGSSQRLQESPTQIIGEFVESMRHESSTSGTKLQKKLSRLENRHLLKRSSQIDSDKPRLVKQDPSHSSGTSGTKGPSDDLAGVKSDDLAGLTDQSVEEATKSGSLDGANSETVIARRTGKYLWNIVTRIFRLQWGSRSETQNSPVRASGEIAPNDSTGGETSPNDSTGETWFSGNEQEEGNGDGMIREEVTMQQEPTSSDQPLPKRSTSRKEGREKSEPPSMPQEPSSSDQPLQTRTSKRGRKDRRKTGQGSILPVSTSQHSLWINPVTDSQGDSRIMTFYDKLSLEERDASASSDASLSGGGMSIGTNIDLNSSQQTSVYSPQDLLVPSARRLKGSDAIEEIEQGGSIFEDLSIGANIDFTMSQQTSVSSPQGLLLPARQLRRTEGFDEIEEGSSVSGVVSIGAKKDFNLSQQSSVSSHQDVAVPSGRRLGRADAYEEAEEQTSSSSEERESGSPNLLVPSTGQLRRLDAIEDIEDAEKNEGLNNPTSEQKVESVGILLSAVPVSEKADTELKQRKLQRTNKVIIDRFDEWEDAYRLENEQRKVDEIFMREALAEAIKAADSWEVPVGAVLVQNGNIIARGYNLVEELRDSTAHAEMICIREASNVLRTWRLSETTLYVTLEPCPMCAGAILQARIGTLVWGAPNKLLGADGSWIRLFPEGVQGDQRLEIAEKPAAPKHPFHSNMQIRRGVLESECAQAMQQFFQLRRKKEKEKAKKPEDDEPSCLPVPRHRSKLFHKRHGDFHLFSP